MALTILCAFAGLSGGVYYEYRRAKDEAKSRLEKDKFDETARTIYNANNIHGRVRDDIFNEGVYQSFLRSKGFKKSQEAVEAVN